MLSHSTLILLYQIKKSNLSFEHTKNFSSVSMNTDRPLFYLFWTHCFVIIQAGIKGPPVVSCHLPEGILDDDRGIGSYADLQIQYMKVFVSAQEIGICSRRLVQGRGGLRIES